MKYAPVEKRDVSDLSVGKIIVAASGKRVSGNLSKNGFNLVLGGALCYSLWIPNVAWAFFLLFAIQPAVPLTLQTPTGYS